MPRRHASSSNGTHSWRKWSQRELNRSLLDVLGRPKSSGGYATNRSPPHGLACLNTAIAASNSAALSALADLNCLRNSAAVAGLRRAATVERTPLGLLGQGLGPGEFFCLPGFAGVGRT